MVISKINTYKPKDVTAGLLLLVTKNNNTRFKQTETKRQETLEFTLTHTAELFPSDKPLRIGYDSRVTKTQGS